ncbi:MAG TPA: hypothetical protein VLI06_01735 [Solimonas sp.]|nr:hypothetical protein [Solimonas sp.]
MREITRALGLAVVVGLLAGCGSSGAPSAAAGGSAGVTPTQPQNLDRSCDEAAYPSAAWTTCEAANYGKSLEAPAEQLDAAFQARFFAQSPINLQEWLARSLADPSWLDPRSGNTPLTPLCTTLESLCVGDPFRYPSAAGPDGMAFYEQEAEVTPVVFYDRDCARLSGRLWLPRNAGSATLPNVVITNGSVQAPETVYWWAAQALVRAGYAVLTYDPRGQGRSDQQTPSLQQGSNLGPHVFWDGQVDAIDFFRSTPARPYPHNVSCAGTYPTETTTYNPIWNRLDPARLGIAGHSLGAIGVSVVQGYGAPGADPWPGQMDAANPVKAAVAWDSLIRSDGAGLAPANDYPLPEAFANALVQIGTVGTLPKFAPRAPSLSFNADYGLVPTPNLVAPNLDNHKLAFAEWQAAGIPAYVLGFQGTTHFDYSPSNTFPATSWCADTSSGACRGGWGGPAIIHYTLAWFDRWLKKAGEPGYADADQRLVDDAGAEGAAKMSFRYRSARDYPDRSGKRQHCEDIRAGCQ